MTTNNVTSKNKNVEISCKLTTAELQDFKSTAVESLRKQVVQTKDLANGYAFKFIGTDKMLDDIIGYIKTERRCCGFIVFNVFINWQ